MGSGGFSPEADDVFVSDASASGFIWLRRFVSLIFTVLLHGYDLCIYIVLQAVCTKFSQYVLHECHANYSHQMPDVSF